MGFAMSKKTASGGAKAVQQKKSLSVLTWNVWFEKRAMDERYAEILRVARESDADFLCFQEVTQAFENAVKKEKTLCKDYDLSGVASAGSWYGVLTLAKKGLGAKFTLGEFKTTRMGRCLLMATATLPGGQTVRLGNVHLESLDSERNRKTQLGVCRKNLNSGSAVDGGILCGDFNFGARWNWHDMRKLASSFTTVLDGSDEWKEKSEPYRGKPKDHKGPAGRLLENHNLAEIMPDYLDTWDTLHPDLPGYTMDSSKNGMLRGFDAIRLDRMMLRKDTFLRPASIEILGTEPLLDKRAAAAKKAEEEKQEAQLQAQGDESDNWPSDHFGLLARFDIVQKNMAEDDDA